MLHKKKVKWVEMWGYAKESCLRAGLTSNTVEEVKLELLHPATKNIFAGGRTRSKLKQPTLKV